MQTKVGEPFDAFVGRVAPEHAHLILAEVARLRAELGDAVDQARLFNRGGLTWLEYDRLLVRWEAIADAQG